MSNHARGEAPASVGQGRHGVVVIVEYRVAGEEPMLLAKVPVHTEVRLVLVVRLCSRSNKVVRAGDVWQRVMLKHLVRN